MEILLIDLPTVQKSGRLDFDFFCPTQETQITLVQGYKKATLASLCSHIGTGKTAPRNSYPDTGVRILKVKNLQEKGVDWKPTFFVTEEFYASAEKKARVRESDILMLCSAHNKVYIGRTAIIKQFPKAVKDDNERCLCVGELIIIRADPARVLPDYLITFLRLPIVQEMVRRMVKGQTAHLYPRDLKNLEVVLPSKQVQQEIADMNAAAEEEYFARIRTATEDLAASRSIIKNLILTGSGDGNGTPESLLIPTAPSDDDTADANQ